MFKKIFLIFLLSVICFPLSIASVSADCVPPLNMSNNCPVDHPYLCGFNNLCCLNSADCGPSPTPDPLPTDAPLCVPPLNMSNNCPSGYAACSSGSICCQNLSLCPPTPTPAFICEPIPNMNTCENLGLVTCPNNQTCCHTLSQCFSPTTIPTPTSLVPPWFCDKTYNTARGIDTGLGCITFWMGPFTGKFLAWGGVLNLGIALIVITVAVIIMITSQGDRKKIQSGWELLTSAGGGVALIVISLLVLNFVGVNVLDLSNLGFKLHSTDGGPIIFRIPTETPIPSATPTPSLKPSPTPIRTPTPKPVTPTPVPRTRFQCCIHKAEATSCKKSCNNGTNLGSCGRGNILCRRTVCDQTAVWCSGDPAPSCIEATSIIGVCN